MKILYFHQKESSNKIQCVVSSIKIKRVGDKCLIIGSNKWY